MRRASITVLLATAALAVGCGGGDEQPPPDPKALRGGQWVLVAGAGIPVATTGGASVEFGARQLGGNDGCNTFSTSYEIDGGEITIGEKIKSTLMACNPEAGDEAFNDALREVAEWSIDEGELVLSDGDGGELLRFGRTSPKGEWRVASLVQGDVISGPLPDTEITASFDEDETLSGSAGCNEYGGRYEADTGRITIRGLTATEMACQPNGVMEQERAYLEALPRAVEYRLDGDQMTLLSRAGTILVSFEPAVD